MPPRETRKLAVVMFTDITGYTRMVEEDEVSALKKVDIHRSVLQQLTTAHNGEVVEFYGDGSLSTYGSAMEAIRCALEMQADYRAQEVPVRIGLHVGEIVYKIGTVFGSGVNIASRIESQGVPGSILLSGRLQKEIANQGEFQTKSLGVFALKNVSEPTQIYALTNTGLIIPPELNPEKTKLSLVLRYALGLIGIVVIGFLLRDSGIFNIGGSLRESVLGDRIAIRFQDYARVSGFEHLDEMASHWIQKQLAEMPNATVVSYESATQQPDIIISTAAISNRRAFSDRTGAINVMEGFIYPTESQDTLQFSLTIVNLEKGEIIHSFQNVKFAVSNVMAGITDLTSIVQGYWLSRDALVLSPPNYEAYKAYLMAQKVWLRDNEKAELELKKSISLDPTFIDPHFLLLDLFYNEKRLNERNEQIELITNQFSELTKRQQNMVNYHQADANGDLIEAFKLFQNELLIDPLDLFTNTNGMVLANSYVNSKDQLIELFKMINVDSLDLTDCGYCIYRIGIAVSAYTDLGELQKAEKLARRIPTSTATSTIHKVTPYIHMGDTATVLGILGDIVRDSLQDYGITFAYAAQRYAVIGRPDLAAIVADSAVLYNNYKGRLISSLMYAKKYKTAFSLIGDWISEYPDHVWVQSFAGMLYAHLGQVDEAHKQIEKLSFIHSENPNLNGEATYYQASILATLGLIEESMDKLEKAQSEGRSFGIWYFDKDPELIPLYNEPRFKKILNPLERDQ